MNVATLSLIATLILGTLPATAQTTFTANEKRYLAEFEVVANEKISKIELINFVRNHPDALIASAKTLCVALQNGISQQELAQITLGVNEETRRRNAFGIDRFDIESRLAPKYFCPQVLQG
ncbi:hypothetical protein IQ264_27760 [Phormidium sp. LEGE 05292]|uniref:hypothetical protein n=1 Tax=[Phormidium] sp. LEGE 05292 TaxID=767427 RepID=UPI001880A976|nr:hypothetical protein [Phormidium sp. LEGE 05292]MBE9229205.1 hypothetical protein [Phormidium sp. LEGE 05292]